VLFPVYAAFAAAFVFYLLIPVIGGFMLRGQWRRFRDRVALLGVAPRLRYGDLASALRGGRAEVGRFRLYGTIEAIEGSDRIWLRGDGVSALVDLSRAPLYVLSSSGSGAGSVQRMNWRSVSSLVEGTRAFAAGILTLEEGRPVFVDRPEEALVAVCHDGVDELSLSRLVESGRAPNEYWNYPTRISLALGLAAEFALLLAFRSTAFSTIRAIVFLVGACPVLPFAPPGLALFFAYHRLWRRALASRVERDLLRLPLRYEKAGGAGAAKYLRRALEKGEAAPEGALRLGTAEGEARSLFAPAGPDDESFVVEGDPEALARLAARDAFFYAAASGICFGLAIALNFALAFIAWRSAF